MVSIILAVLCCKYIFDASKYAKNNMICYVILNCSLAIITAILLVACQFR